MPWLTRGNWVLLGTDYQDGYPPNRIQYQPRYEDRWLAGSHGNYGYPDFRGRKNVGSPFLLRGVQTVHTPSGNVDIWRGGPNNQHYAGMFIATGQGYSQPNITERDMTGSAWGAEAWAKMKPTKPEFSGLNAIFELRDIPRMLRQRFHTSGLKGIGNYHLAIQFGWIPLLRDVRAFSQFQRVAQKRLKQLLRDNGRPVRRRVQLSSHSSPNDVTSGAGYGALNPVLVTQYYASQPTWRRTTYARETVWASARFRYWLPGGPRDVAWTRKMLARLHGLTPSPSSVYNAIPWSWLIDWFTNLGSLIENLDVGVADRLAADYLYIMRHREWSVEYQANGLFKTKQGVLVPVSASKVSTAFSKSRVPGSPFDPALKDGDLSAHQLGILGALGISRL